MRVSYTAAAREDLQAIHSYITQHNPRAADQVIARILQALSILEAFPLIGRAGRVDGTREWVITGLPYTGIYVLADPVNVEVIAVIHNARAYP